MELTETRLGEVPVIGVHGDVDHETSSTFHEAAQRALGREGNRILFDLNGCTHLDSGGLAVLFSLANWAVQHDGWVGLVGPGPHVRRMVEIAGIGSHSGFRVFADLDEAGMAVDS